MSVWIQSLFSALLPLPPKLMWQKMENHEWLCLRLVWGTVTTVWSRGAPRRQAHLSLGGKKGWLRLTALCSVRGFVSPCWGGARSQRAHLRVRGQTWGTSTCGSASGAQLLPRGPCAAPFCRKRGWRLPSIPVVESLLGSFCSWWGER